jgi:hypothetical protein
VGGYKMFMVKVSYNNSVVYALTYKAKKAANKRFENAKKVFNDEGYDVELLNVSDNVDIFEVYGL